jgi:hypothetical protein
VWVDPSLGAQALQNANDLINDADRIVAANDKIFGTPGQHVDVIIFAINGMTDGTGRRRSRELRLCDRRRDRGLRLLW